jgi:phospholipid/cholesterol/gamma-HCH transport system substrate-binding protein
MPYEISRTRAFLNAILATAVVAVAVYGASLVARRHWQWQRTFEVRVELPNAGGLEAGGKVRIQGIDAGVVESILAPAVPGKPVVLVLKVDEQLHPLVRADATVRIVSQGVLGAKLVELVPGLADAPPLNQSAVLRAEPVAELSDLVKDAARVLKGVDAMVETATQGLTEINQLVAEVRAGRGSLGKLVRDDEAYQRLMSLSHRGEKSLNHLDENLIALKKTWPISRYFTGRGFDDRDRVLFQPGSIRETRTLRIDDLFTSGTAVLKPAGKQELDAVARWFYNVRRSKETEVVIAAFSDDANSDEDLVQALTEKQAEAVRDYLTKKHAIDSTGWFSSRRVAAVGFGTHTPRFGAETMNGAKVQGRRVEVVVFTPQV